VWLEPGCADRSVRRRPGVFGQQRELHGVEQLVVELHQLLVELQQLLIEQRLDVEQLLEQQFILVEQLDLVRLQRLFVEQLVLEQSVLGRIRVVEFLEQQR
jgi:hypothetical protein